MNKYVIGVDAGGTRTVAAAYGLDKSFISRGEAAYGNVLIDKDMAIEHVCAAINMAMEGLNPSDCQLILIGAAGVGDEGNRITLQKAISERFPIPVTVINDAELALEAGLSGGDGILVISGTGSIGMCRWHGVISRAGGWGNIVGDEGSAFNIVLQMVRRMTHCADNALPVSTLGAQLLHAANVGTPRELVGLLHTRPKGDIAALASIIAQQADAGNIEAVELLSEAGISLAQLVICLLNARQINGKFSLALRGGVLEHMPMVRKAMLDYLADKGFEYELSTSDDHNTIAAWHVHHRSISQ